MAATGIVVEDSVVAEFNELKLGRVKAKFVIYKIEGPQIIKDSMSSADASFNDLREYHTHSIWIPICNVFEKPDSSLILFLFHNSIRFACG